MMTIWLWLKTRLETNPSKLLLCVVVCLTCIPCGQPMVNKNNYNLTFILLNLYNGHTLTYLWISLVLNHNSKDVSVPLLAIEINMHALYFPQAFYGR